MKKHKPISLAVSDEEEWLGLRKATIGGSEVATLFGCGYSSYFQLWMEKAGRLEPNDLSANERVVLGQVIEPAIAEAGRRLLGLDLRKVHRYLMHPSVNRMGASLDYEITVDGHRYPLEIKNVDRSVWYTEWPETEDGRIPPLKILYQVQHQIAVYGAERGYVLALVGGNKLELCEIPRHDKVVAIIEKAVTDFWASISASVEPAPDFSVDYDAYAQVFNNADGTKDMRGNPTFAGLMVEYVEHSMTRKRADEASKRVRGELMRLAGEAEVVIADGGTVRCPVDKRTNKRTCRVYPKQELKESFE